MFRYLALFLISFVGCTCSLERERKGLADALELSVEQSVAEKAKKKPLTEAELREKIESLKPDLYFPLSWTAQKKIIQERLANKCNPDSIVYAKRYADRSEKELVRCTTALSAATTHSDIELVKALFQAGASINQPEALYEEPLLFKAKTRAIAEFLIEKNADVNVTRAVRGETLMHRVARHGYELDLLYLYGFDLNYTAADQDMHYRTPLHILIKEVDSYATKEIERKKIHSDEPSQDWMVTYLNKGLIYVRLGYSLASSTNQRHLTTVDDINCEINRRRELEKDTAKRSEASRRFSRSCINALSGLRVVVKKGLALSSDEVVEVGGLDVTSSGKISVKLKRPQGGKGDTSWPGSRNTSQNSSPTGSPRKSGERANLSSIEEIDLKTGSESLARMEAEALACSGSSPQQTLQDPATALQFVSKLNLLAIEQDATSVSPSPSPRESYVLPISPSNLSVILDTSTSSISSSQSTREASEAVLKLSSEREVLASESNANANSPEAAAVLQQDQPRSSQETEGDNAAASQPKSKKTDEDVVTQKECCVIS